jgi:hypothetical protein
MALRDLIGFAMRVFREPALVGGPIRSWSSGRGGVELIVVDCS